MAKKGEKGKDGKKGSKAKASEEEEKKEEEVVVEIVPDYRTITVVLESYENIVAIFPAATVTTKCQYLDQVLGDSEEILITDSPILTIIDQQFAFTCDINSAKDLDSLVSNPIIFTITQIPGIFNPELNPPELELLEIDRSSLNSIISLYEAFTGDTVEKTIEIMEKIKKGGKKSKDKLKKNDSAKSSKSSKDSKSGKLSKGGKGSKGATVEAKKKEPAPGPTIIGTCTLDLLPLFLGKESFTETLLIKPPEIFFDDRMVTYKTKPKLIVKILLDHLFSFQTEPTILNLTMESIFSIPPEITENAECKTCLNLPKLPLVLENGSYTTNVSDKFIFWPNMQYLTRYEINNAEIYNLQNNANVDLGKILNEDEKPKITFNCLKRNVIFRDDFFAIYDHLRKYRKIALEIFIPSPEKKASVGGAKKGGTPKGAKKDKKDKSSKSSGKKSAVSEDIKTPSGTHYMVILDLSTLLYPGTTRVRVASPLTTFHDEEALKFAGLADSFFVPKPKVVPAAADKPGKGKKQKDAGGKKKGGSDKKSKSSKGSKNKGGDESSAPLPEPCLIPPVPKPPSIRIFNEDCQPTFVILDIELSKPFVQRRDVEDLHESLQELIQQKPALPKIILTPQLSKNYYHELINQLTQDLKKKYVQYLDEKTLCHCDNQADFMTYLRRTGIYETYLASLTKSTATIARNKFKIIDSAYNSDLVEYENFIGEVFVFLVDEMNSVLNKIAYNNFKEGTEVDVDYMKTLLFYAKEATELGEYELAEHYYMQRLCQDGKNPNYWFDYAIYQMQMNDFEIAFECLQEALSRETLHRNSLLLYAILLTEKNQNEEAETCFLTLTVQEPRWVEAWAIFYMFYEKTQNTGGMELTRKMAVKYLNDPRTPLDYFSDTNELIWNKSLIPNTIFFRTAALLLRFRMFMWVEDALAHEFSVKACVRNYLLAVICYYKKKYDHALNHLEEAKSLDGPNTAFMSLSAHCYYAKGDLESAKVEYYHLLESCVQIENMHLNYINSSKIMEVFQNDQEARKIILIACKKRPTPRTWFACGKLYFQQEDYLSAEECFSESNLLDNCLPETWGYLTLVNLKLFNYSEAELCFSQAVKNELKDVSLLNKIAEVTSDLKKSQEKH